MRESTELSKPANQQSVQSGHPSTLRQSTQSSTWLPSLLSNGLTAASQWAGNWYQRAKENVQYVFSELEKPIYLTALQDPEVVQYLSWRAHIDLENEWKEQVFCQELIWSVIQLSGKQIENKNIKSLLRNYVGRIDQNFYEVIEKIILTFLDDADAYYKNHSDQETETLFVILPNKIVRSVIDEIKESFNHYEKEISVEEIAKEINESEDKNDVEKSFYQTVKDSLRSGYDFLRHHPKKVVTAIATTAALTYSMTYEGTRSNATDFNPFSQSQFPQWSAPTWQTINTFTNAATIFGLSYASFGRKFAAPSMFSAMAFSLAQSVTSTTSTTTSFSSASTMTSTTGSSLPSSFYFKTFGGANADVLYSLYMTNKSSAVLAGATDSYGAGLGDILLTQFNMNGYPNWTKTVGGAGAEVAVSTYGSGDGGYVISGSTDSAGVASRDIFLIKLTENGLVTWAKLLGGSGWDQGWVVRPSGDGGYFVVGSTDSYGAGGHDILFVKFSNSGNLIWANVLGGSGLDELARALITTSDNSGIAVGHTNNFGAGAEDAFIVKFDRNGTKVWAKAFGGVNSDIVNSLQETIDNSLIVTGSTQSFGAGLSDILLVKFDINGNLLWAEAIGGIDDDGGISVRQTADGKYVVAGETWSYGAGERDLLLIQLDETGRLIWAKVLGGTLVDKAVDMGLTPDNGYFVAGITNSFGAGGLDFLIAKFNSNGEIPGCALIQDVTANITVTPITLIVTPITATMQPISPTVQDWNITAVDQTPILQTHCEYLPISYMKAIGGNNTEYANSITNSGDGGIYVTGGTYTFSNGDLDLMLLKLNYLGELEWSATIGGPSVDGGVSLLSMNNGDVLVVGWAMSFGAGGEDVLLTRFNTTGERQWCKTIGNNRWNVGHSLLKATGTNMLVLGWTDSSTATSELLLMEITETGNLIWAKTYGDGGINYEQGRSLCKMSDNNIAMLGWTESYGASRDIMLIKSDNQGNLIWARAIGGSNEDYGRSVYCTNDNSMVLTGFTRSFGAGLQDIIVVKFDGNGNLLWAKTFGGSEEDEGFSVQPSQNNNTILFGHTRSFSVGDYDLFRAELDNNGDLIWAKTYGGDGHDYAYAAYQRKDGGALMTGSTSDFGAGNQDFLVVRIDTNNTIPGCSDILDVTSNVTVQLIAPTVTPITPIVNPITLTVQNCSVSAIPRLPRIQTKCEYFPISTASSTSSSESTSTSSTSTIRSTSRFFSTTRTARQTSTSTTDRSTTIDTTSNVISSPEEPSSNVVVILGIVLGIVCGIGTVGVLGLYLLRRNKNTEKVDGNNETELTGDNVTQKGRAGIYDSVSELFDEGGTTEKGKSPYGKVPIQVGERVAGDQESIYQATPSRIKPQDNPTSDTTESPYGMTPSRVTALP